MFIYFIRNKLSDARKNTTKTISWKKEKGNIQQKKLVHITFRWSKWKK